MCQKEISSTIEVDSIKIFRLFEIFYMSSFLRVKNLNFLQGLIYWMILGILFSILSPTWIIKWEGNKINLICSIYFQEEGEVKNCLIVYDLSSGQLFKKLKAKVNFISVEINEELNLIIGCLENAQLIIYDLVTGSKE